MTETVLEVRNLKKTFELKGGQQLEAVADVSFEVARGEIVSIIGPSGCGKSTVLNMLARLLPPTGGQILYHSQNGDFRIGYVFQESRLLPWQTVLGNVVFGLDGCYPDMPRSEKERVAMEYIELVGLRGFEDKYPYQISGGMQQRVAVARGLAINPTILLLDEPFGALDALTRAYLQEELVAIVSKAQKTVVLITHDIDEACLLGDKVLVMTHRPGRIRESIRLHFPRPRKLAELALLEEYHRVKHHLLSLLRGEITEAMAS
jgi:ABC-type nitrate/sulfonate/bicarbonate transport system ATPase subunit